jgi:geranylgeranyl diphosphate synthase type I
MKANTLTLLTSSAATATAAHEAHNPLSAIAKHFPNWTEKAASIAAIEAAVRDEIRHHRGDYATPLDDIVQYAVAKPGKMLRGLMLIEACKAVGGDPANVLPAAAGTEFGHLASLIHDDIIDQDETRRGRSAVWRKYGVNDAILAGDVFIFHAYHALAQCRHSVGADRVVRVLEILSRACVELCLGQSHEAKLMGDCSITKDEYLNAVRGKTGSLFRVAAESGATLGGGSDAQIAAVREYAESLGVAYQIVDDLLCYLGQDTVLLKSTKSDVKNRRVTLPILYALEAADEHERATLRDIFEGDADVDELSDAHRTVCEILDRTGAVARAKADAMALSDRALAHLYTLPANDGRNCLETIARLAMHRNR